MDLTESFKRNKGKGSLLVILGKLLYYQTKINLALWALHTFLKNMGWLPKKSVKGKHVFVTGAGSGLGRSMSEILAKKGAKISVSDVNLKSA